MAYLFHRVRPAAPIAALFWLSSVPAAAQVVQDCIDPGKMYNVLARFTSSANPPYNVYTRAIGGQPISATNPRDPLVNHLSDFLNAGYNKNIDPRFEATIAGTETTFGTQGAFLGSPKPETTELRNNNPFGLKPKETVYPNLGTPDIGSIDVEGVQIATWIRRGCQTIDSYIVSECGCHACGPPLDPKKQARWINTAKFHYGSAATKPNMGGNPNTTDLTFDKNGRGGFCAFADCDGSGSVDVTDIVTMVNIALGEAPVSECTAGASDANCVSTSVATSTAAGGTPTGIFPDPSCGAVAVPQILRGIFVAFNGPGDPVPLPTLPPSQMEPDPCEGCWSCALQCQGGHCGTDDCTFCEAGCPYNPCAACNGPSGSPDCGACISSGHCGDYPSTDGPGCTFCEDFCATPTPSPPPTPTPSATAICTIVMTGPHNSRVLRGYDCQTMYAAVKVLPPFVPTSAEITQSYLDKIPMKEAAPDSHGVPRFVRAGYIVGEGQFTVIVTAYGKTGEGDHEKLCWQEFDGTDPPEALGVCYPPLQCPVIFDPVGGELDATLCGLGSGTTPGLVETPPATVTPTQSPTPTVKCSVGPLLVGGLTQAQLQAKNQGTDPGTCRCNELHFSVNVSPPGAATNIHLRVTNNTINQVQAEVDFCPAIYAGAVCDISGGHFEHVSVIYESQVSCLSTGGQSITYMLTAYNGQNMICGRSYSTTVSHTKESGRYCDCPAPPLYACGGDDAWMLCGCGFNTDWSACNCCRHTCGLTSGTAASADDTFGIISSNIPPSASAPSFTIPFQ